LQTKLIDWRVQIVLATINRLATVWVAAALDLPRYVVLPPILHTPFASATPVFRRPSCGSAHDASAPEVLNINRPIILTEDGSRAKRRPQGWSQLRGVAKR
jgi:hypothetical protein